MHQEYYDSGRLLTRSAGWGLFALLCLWIGGFFGVLVGVLTLLMGFAYLSKALGDRIAVRFGQCDVELHGLGQNVSMRWEDVEDITIRPLKSRLFGFIPTFPTPQLTLINKDRQPLDIGVPVRLLALDQEGLLRLVKVMIMARGGGYDLLDPKTGELRPNPAAAETAAQGPAAGGFGRKGL